MKKERSLSILTAMRRTVPLIARQYPGLLLMHVSLILATGLLSGVTVMVNEIFYNALAELALGNGTLSVVYRAAGLAVVVLGGALIAGVLQTLINDYRRERTAGTLLFLVHKKKANIPAQLFEDKEALDHIEKAHAGMHSAQAFLNMLLDLIFFRGAYFIIMGVYLWRIQPILLISLTFVFIPVSLSQIVQARIHAKLQDTTTPITRQENSYRMHALDNRETRLFGVFHHFHKMVLTTRQLYFRKQWDTQFKIHLIDLGLNIIKMVGWIGVILLILRALINGYTTVGGFAAVFAAIGTMFNHFEDVFSSIQNNITRNLGSLHHFIKFLDLPETTAGERTVPDWSKKGVVATNVSFTYPAASHPTIKNISLSIHMGETLAIVGENGSGKTTLVKLICGLYKPTSGSVTIGGADTILTADRALFTDISAVFQDFVRYSILNLKENVSISRHDSIHDAVPALLEADVHYQDRDVFPLGLETIMSRDLDGVELSSGQWQRLAMARGLYRKYEFIILDEPTAAIDPLEESRIYHKFAELTKGKTAVLVTHRLGSARIADRIIVMDGGRIVESGKHIDLIKLGGKYAQMWHVQAADYQ